MSNFRRIVFSLGIQMLLCLIGLGAAQEQLTSTVTGGPELPPVTEIRTSVVVQPTVPTDAVTVIVTATRPSSSTTLPEQDPSTSASAPVVPTISSSSASLETTESPSSTSSPEPPTAPPTDGNVTAEYKLFGWIGCSAEDERAIKDGLREAQTILAADCNYNFAKEECQHSLNMVDFFGRPVDFKDKDRRDKIQTNFRNAYNFANNGWFFTGKQLMIHCHDGSMEPPLRDECSSEHQPNSVVVVRGYGSEQKPAMMFCDSWFRMGRLADAIKAGLRSEGDEPYDLSRYENRSRAWITALMMIPMVAPWPVSGGTGPDITYRKINFRGYVGEQYVTTAALCRYLGRLRNQITTGWRRTTGNADTYSWYALASYVQEPGRLGEYPVLPFVPEGAI